MPSGGARCPGVGRYIQCNVCVCACRDVEETSERVAQKAAQFASTELGRDLRAAHELRRRHGARAAEASAIGDRIRALTADGHALADR